MTKVPDWLRRQAAARPSRTAVVAPGGSEALRFDALDARVAVRAGALAASGPEGRVALLLENGVPLVECLLACVRLGRAAVLLDPRLAAEEIRPLVEATAPGVLVAQGATSEVGRALAREIDASFVDADEARSTGTITRAPSIDLEREAVIVFSSGTTGPAKPVALTAANLLWSAMGSAARLGAAEDDRWLACLPLSHLGGLSILFRSVLFGSTMILHAGFDPAAVARALAEEHVSMISLVPTTLERLLDDPSVVAPSLRCALIGGAGAPLELLQSARERGIPVSPTYGLTETASQVATLAPDAPLVETGHVGAPLLPTDVSIRLDDGNPADAGEVGRILVRGATVASGSADSDGWLHTGDVGRLDDAGALTVLGRLDDVIVSGGENVSPTDVEAVLARLPGVAEVAVAPVADAEWGHVVGAWVVPAPGAELSLEGLRSACAPSLAPHKRPRHLTVVQALPRTALGKIRRRELVGREPS